jgi:2-polyprenyl-3-methyl-5-hydroxy-6-metoxy-1,4-benzoquinol methylase
MTSLASRRVAGEQMDDPGLAPDVYAAVLADLAHLNGLLMTPRPTLNLIARAIGAKRRFRLLDVGYGHGDMLRAIARWAQRREIEAELVGVDLNPKSRAVAEAATDAALGIQYRTGDYADTAGENWDFVVSSSVTHHMTDAEIVAFLRFMEREARMGWIVNDLHRHAFAYYGFPLLARLIGWHRMVREDGRMSIARAFRANDWRRLLAEAGIGNKSSTIERRFPFRLCVERTR